MGPNAMIYVFWMLSFKPTFSLFSFTFIKRLFSSSSLSAIRVQVWLNQIPYDYRVEVRNIFKARDLIECLMNYGQRFMTLYKRQGARWSSRKRNAKRQNGCLKKALQIDEKRRKTKCKGEKERYTHLNVEFQRIARRDKNDFLTDQCKEIEENNRIGKTKILFKKIRDTKGTLHAKMGTIKDRNDMDLTEAEDT